MPSDVLQPRPAMLRPLRQRLREQVPHFARRGLHHEMRRQAHEGLPTVRRQVPGAERSYGTGRHAWQVKPRAIGIGRICGLGKFTTAELCNSAIRHWLRPACARPWECLTG
jgi:hypothetical protein